MLLVVLGGVMLPSCGSAMDNGVLEVGLLASERYDSNLFRLPEGVMPAAGPGGSARSDFVTATGVGFRIDKSYSQQRFIIDANLLHHDYRHHGYLNYTSRSGDASWRWTLTPNLTGDLTYSRAESLNSFADFTGYNQRNINTNENSGISLDWMADGAWHTALAISQLWQRNDLPVLTLEDVRIRSAEASLRYVFLAGNSLAGYFRHGSGKYLNRTLDAVNQLDTEFVERETGVRAAWQITGKSGLYGQVGFLSRDHDHFGSRDFNGAVGQLRYHWDITGKTLLEAEGSRTLGSYQASSSSYLVTDTFGIGPSWNATPATRFTARYLATRYEYRGALAGAGVLRRDTVRGASLTARWEISNPLALEASWAHNNRGSNLPGLEFSDNTAMISAKAKF